MNSVGLCPLFRPLDGPFLPLRRRGYIQVRRAFAGLLACTLVTSAARAQDADSLNPLKAVSKASLETFVQKPLFDPARQLPPPPPPIVVSTAPAPPPPPEPAPALQLLGVVRGHRGDMAVVHRDGNEKTVVLRTGDKLGNWTVTVRPPVGVTLREGDRTIDFAIFAKATQGAPQPPRTLPIGPGLRRQPDE